MKEIVIYLSVIVILAALKRVLSGLDNACFYAKGKPDPHPLLQKYLADYHYLETPSWYTTFGVVFLAALAIARLVHPEFTWLGYGKQAFGSYLIAMGSSGMSNYWYQGFINLSEGSPFENPNENPKSEFAFGPIHFWWTRPWGGKRRKYVVLIGALSVMLGMYLIF